MYKRIDGATWQNEDIGDGVPVIYHQDLEKRYHTRGVRIEIVEICVTIIQLREK